MATSQMNDVLQHLRRAVLLRDGADLTDGQLLADYLRRRDEAALAALVRRHAPMVWGVCRRVLRNYHDAEDAFQATFLVFVRKAASLAAPELLANWLYGVAHQTALKARATAARRKGRERQVTEMPQPTALEQDLWRDLQPLLDEELSRLPDKYRAVVVLCDLEGKTRKDAARQLGCPEGTVAGRLARARTMLAKRLTHRGVALSGGALAVVLAQQAATAGVPSSVVDATINAASLLAAGNAAETGVISVKVAALTEGVLKAMLYTKLTAAVAVVLILGFVATGVTILTCRTAAAQAQEQKDALKTLPGKEADKSKTDQELIQGTWVYVALAVGGKSKWSDDVARVWKSLSFADDVVRLVVNQDGKEVVHQGRFKLHPSRKPKEIDLIELDPDLKETITGCLYELDGDTLRLCHPKNSGGDRPRALESKEGSTDWLWTLKRNAKENLKREKEKPPQKQEKDKPVEDREKLQGEWQAVEVELRGEKAPAELSKRFRILFKGDVIALTTPQEESKGEFKLDSRKSPKQIDITPLDGPLAGKTIAAIYSLDRAVLMICLPEAFKAPDQRPQAFKTGEGNGQLLLKLRRKTAAGQDQKKPTTEKPVAPAAKQEKDKEAFTAWGKEINGLQAGLGFRSGEQRAYHYGETLILVIRVRNVGTETVKFSYLMPYIEHEPIVTTGDGKRVPQPGEARLYEIGARLPGQVELAPGKEIELHELKRELKPASESGSRQSRPEGHPHAFYGTGKVSVQYEHVLGNPVLGHPGWKLDPILSMLATGKLELEIKADPPPQKQEKKAFTAWGKEINGLQAGLGLRPGERRVYHHGESVTLIVRIRNVGKKTVKFEYLRQFLDEEPPTVTKADGTTFLQPGTDVLGFHGPVAVTLEPGKEIELESRMAGGAKRAGAPGIRYGIGPELGTGKVSFQYERVFGNSSAGSTNIDAALRRLATGTLELEIKEAAKK
jgi:RNA polymerase sigma factor (sigma-70 family)